ncbi:MAG: His/Gly/Thr/Pro-type tRNA ligase C-terminal domain-containing protein [Candidatus Diapherotrites archaeon]|nr:His/Gly/Thr/Pro-type tRNA ligase C-terminal domain-containing protein [Candidatus Diapherotrites archaeon]
MIIKKNEVEYSKWWNQLIQDGNLVDIRYNIKGFFVWMPYGFSVMKKIKQIWDDLFKEQQISEMYFPLLVPEEYAMKNSSWWSSFKEQAFYALGYFDTEKKLFLRPTGEPAMYPMFSTWIRSYRDLPFRIYETVSAFRNETKSTKVFVRDVELGPWYEIHTCHATREEAEKEIELAIKMNEKIFEDLAIYPLKVRKPKVDCFPGSAGAVEFYTLMNDKVVENGSCNNLGQAYAKAFDIQFIDSDQQKKLVWQTCTGNGERFLSSIISNHGDEKGLIIPPNIAPIKVSILGIKIAQGNPEIEQLIKNLGVERDRIQTAYAEDVTSIGEIRYKTERMGVPLRIEIGPKELASKSCTLCWRDGTKEKSTFEVVAEHIKTGFNKMQNKLYIETKKELENRLHKCDTIEEAKKAMIAEIGWCGKEECANWIKHDTGKDIIGMVLVKKEKKCIRCGETGETTYVSESY